MAPKQPCAKYQYIVTAAGPKIVPVPDAYSKDEEAPADYNSGGYLQVKINDSFKDGRYLVLRKLGWGHFSTVWLVRDNQTSKHSALKVVKSAGRYAETARDEIKLLQQVMDANPTHRGRAHIVSFLDHFQQVSADNVHICLVFEPLGENLLALIERHKKTGVAVDLVRVIAKQVLLGLEYLHDECDLVHTDIKPENILISIPDVEAHIRAELSRSPSPTYRTVGVPPKQVARTAVAIPRKGRAERHVEIFDSQPLSSPSSYSAPNSPATFKSVLSRVSSGRSSKLSSPLLQMSATSRRPSLSKQAVPSPLEDRQLPKAATPALSEGSSSSGYDSALVSASVSTSFTSNETSPTSLPGIIERVQKLSITDPDATICLDRDDEDLAEHNPHGSFLTQARPPAGPSLLSQTAPRNLSPLASHSETPSSSETLPLPSDSEPTTTRPSPSPSTPPTPPPLPISIKIADLGNAAPTRKHYTEDIQTRQYRSPEAIVGRTDWGATADVWSVACVLFELLTAEYLFDPQSQGDAFGKDDDHVAQIVELLGEFGETQWGGRYSRELFDSSGALRYIRNLKPWPLRRVMVEKYLWSDEDAAAVCDFLEPMLTIDHRKRKQAREMVDHPWLEVDPQSEALWGW